MADDTNTAEREAFEAWIAESGREHMLKRDPENGWYEDLEVTARWAAWQARASLAASAGREAVAADGWLHENGLLYRLTDERHTCNRDEINVTMADGSRSIESRSRRALELLDRIRATHPSPPEGMAGWISVDERLPESGTPVLLDIGKKYPIRAMWAPAKTLEASNDSDAVGDYDEATDTYYCPEGWYEWNQHEKTHWFVTETPRAWMPLPASEAKEL